MFSRWLPSALLWLPGLLGAPLAFASERVSDDVVIIAGDDARIANVVLGSSVSGNSLAFTPSQGHLDSGLEAGILVQGSENFSTLFGVNALALNSGHAAVQSVTINAYVVIGVPAGQTDTGTSLFESTTP